MFVVIKLSSARLELGQYHGVVQRNGITSDRGGITCKRQILTDAVTGSWASCISQCEGGYGNGMATCHRLNRTST